jgi:hypothetical protein
MAMLYDGPYPTAFYRHLHAALHAGFRLQKGRGRGVLHSSPRQLLGIVRDAFMLPFLNLRLAFDRLRYRRNSGRLPVLLSRDQASTPSS